jgi:hypothetical protein
MDISIFGYKLNLQVLILIGVVYLILVGHTLCGCSNYNLMEAFTDASGNLAKAVQDLSGNVPLPAGGVVANKVKGVVQSKEGFVGANINYGQSSPYDLNSNVAVDTSSWSAPDMTVVPGQPLNPAVKKFLAREPQPVPLPEGEMFMFATTPFKPECCPNTYSNSSGCACMTGAQYNWLQTRAGNNVPYSEY